MIYADDYQLYVAFEFNCANTRALSISNIETCVHKMATWLTSNKLQLNPSKTEMLVIASPFHHQRIESIQLNISGSVITPKDCVRNLGVLFDKHLNMKQQVSNMCKACYLHLRSIWSIKHLLEKEACINVIHAFICSRLDYCNSLLLGLPQCELNRLQRMQNMAARVATGTPRSEHIKPILKELHWLPIKERIEFKALMLVYKILNGLAPPYLEDLIVVKQNVRALRSSDQKCLVVPQTRLRAYGDAAFSCKAPALWNKLPPKVQMAQTISQFKCELKCHLLNKHFGNFFKSSLSVSVY